MSTRAVTIEAWADVHPRWPELAAVIDGAGQTDWVAFQADFHRSSHMLVALLNGEIVGFLRYVCQPIGPDNDCPPVILHGQELIEAKVLAFAVVESHRRLGIGRALQQHALRHAKAQGCYQLRSYSSGGNRANHQLKVSLGFGVHPVVRGDDRRGVYFIMPLQNVE